MGSEAAAGVGFVEEDLALEVREFDEVAVNQGESADAGADEKRGGGGSGGSAADDGGVGSGEAALTFVADGREEDLAGVAAVWMVRGRGGGHGFSIEKRLMSLKGTRVPDGEERLAQS